MARIAKAPAEPPPEEPRDAWRTARAVIAVLMFAGLAAIMPYGAWLAFYMHLSKSMPQDAVLRFLGCAVLAAALYTVCVRVEPLPARRRKRGKRWINVETPTTWQIWETAPGDFVEAVLTAVGMMATPTMLFVGFGLFVAFEDLPDLLIATAVAAGAFAVEGAFIGWRGRSMFDPPGKVRTAKEPEPATRRSDSDTPEIVDSGSDSSDD